MDTIRYRIFTESGKIHRDEPVNISSEQFVDWRFSLRIKGVLQVHGTNPERLVFLYINEDLPNHKEICETVLNIAKEINRIP